MIEKINLDSFEIVGNYVLIKPDKNHDYIEVSGPLGIKVELQLVDFTSTQEQLQAITGLVLKVPEKLTFSSELKNRVKGKTISNGEYESLMNTSCMYKTKLNVKVGDRITFDRRFAIDAEMCGLLVNVEGIGYAVLMPYSILFCKEVDGKFVPLNGWVFFDRDQKPMETLLDSGLVVIEKVDKYGSIYATVRCADEPVEEYLEKGYWESPVALLEGQRIILQKGFGFRIAVDRFAGGLTAVECCRRNRIIALINETGKTVEEHFVPI